MKKLNIKKIFIIMLSLSLLSISAGTYAQPISVGQEAVDFTLETLSGEKITLMDELKTKKAVLVFFATWCPHCASAVPHINAFYERNKDKVAVIALDIQEPKDKVENFVKKRKVAYPVVMDSDGRVTNSYGISGIPTVIAVDNNGKILYRGTSINDMENRIEF